MPWCRLAILLLVAGLNGCVTIPEGAYYPPPGQPETRKLSETLYRAAQAAGDDSARYSFALVASRDVAAYTADGATFYFSEGLTR